MNIKNYKQNEKAKKIFIIIGIIYISAIIITITTLIWNNFINGKVMDVSNIKIEFLQDFTVTDKKVFFRLGFFPDSAPFHGEVMSKYWYRIENDIMYIKIKTVNSGFNEILGFPDDIDIEGDFSTLQKIILKDNKNEKVIWEYDKN